MLVFVESWLWAAITPLVFWLISRSVLLAIGVAIAVAVYFVLAVARAEIFEPRVIRRPPRTLFARSAIVRLDRIDVLLRAAGGDYAVRLKDGTELPVSRSRREQLEGRLGRAG